MPKRDITICRLERKSKMETSVNASGPIGVFDYGIGGLNVVKALSAAFPDEHFIFFADEAKINTPEAEDMARLHRTEDALRYAAFVRAQGAKMIVIGCNLMSAFARDTLCQKLDVPVIGMVEPAIAMLSQCFSEPEKHKIAVFTTEMAACLRVFTKKFQTAFQGIRVAEIGCGKLPGLISAGLAGTEETDCVVRSYAELAGNDIDAALLACTRFPMLMDTFERAMPAIPIIDPAQMLPQLTEAVLERGNLCAPKGIPDKSILYTTGDSAAFKKAADDIFEGSLEYSVMHTDIPQN